ncbi:hypothetical protein ACSBR2_003268 [Camellia fascicularis]
MHGGGANTVSSGYTKGNGHGAEMMGAFILVYTVSSATDAMRNARDSHVPVNFSTTANWVRRVLGTPGNDPNYRERY